MAVDVLFNHVPVIALHLYPIHYLHTFLLVKKIDAWCPHDAGRLKTYKGKVGTRQRSTSFRTIHMTLQVGNRLYVEK